MNYNSVASTLWLPSGRSKYWQGAFQLLGITTSIAIAAAAGIAIGLLLMVTSGLDSFQVFNDSTYVDKNEDNTLRQNRIAGGFQANQPYQGNPPL